MWERKSFVELWDFVVFAMSMPVVLLMGLSLPADWDHHTGHSQPGTATVTSVEPTRGGSHITVDVRSASGELLASGHEVNGDAPHRLGATFDISYATPDGIGTTQVYTAGHDPVSYTHLRAHETVLDLVCRLLLEKKKNDTTHTSDNYNINTKPSETNHTIEPAPRITNSHVRN